jgi:hypothetical protein
MPAGREKGLMTSGAENIFKLFHPRLHRLLKSQLGGKFGHFMFPQSREAIEVSDFSSCAP